MTDLIDVLLIEDNPYDGEFAIRALRLKYPDIQIIHLRDGQVALEFLLGEGVYAERSQLNLPKVILLDLKLFALGGLEVLRMLKSNPRTKAVPVVVMTSSQEENDLDQAYEFGANSYIVKPVVCEIFSRTISDLGVYWLSLNRLPPTTTHEHPRLESSENSFP